MDAAGSGDMDVRVAQDVRRQDSGRDALLRISLSRSKPLGNKAFARFLRLTPLYIMRSWPVIPK
jgi:hypothetical protein